MHDNNTDNPTNLYPSLKIQGPPPYKQERNWNTFVEEYYRRDRDPTNIINEDYEYTKPQTLIFQAPSGTASQIVTVQNPFNTPAQFCLLYMALKEQFDYVSINFDQPASTGFPSTQFVPGMIFNDNIQPVPQNYWIDFSDYIQCFMNVGTIGTNIIIGFRRLREHVIPRNFTPLNEPSQ